MVGWAWVTLQSCRRPVRFFVISIMARYSIFSRLPSVGKTDFAFVTFRSWRLKPSIVLGVDQPAHFLRVLEIGAQVRQVFRIKAVLHELGNSFLKQVLNVFHAADVDCLQQSPNSGAAFYLFRAAFFLCYYVKPPSWCFHSTPQWRFSQNQGQSLFRFGFQEGSACLK